MSSQPIRLGIGGPVGSGKTRLIERLVPLFTSEGLRVGIITNDLVTKEDAIRVQASGLLSPDLVIGIETGACPHTAIREDPSVNLEAVAQLQQQFELDVILIESGGDNLAATFSPDLADYWIFVIDCAAGDDIPRKRGLGTVRADLLIVNKSDLAVHVGADLERMRRDLESLRGERPWLFTNLQDDRSAANIFEHLRRTILFGVGRRIA